LPKTVGSSHGPSPDGAELPSVGESTTHESRSRVDAVEVERRRILHSLLERIEFLAERAICKMRAEIPAYAAQGERFFDDVAQQLCAHYEADLTVMAENRRVTLDDIKFLRAGAIRRVRSGLALHDYLNAFRVGTQVLWEEILATAGDTHAGHEAALRLVAPLQLYSDFASSYAAHTYVEFERYVLADADRERRDLLERLLVGEVPVRGPLLAVASRYGLRREARALVAVAVPVDQHHDADAPQAASAALTRAVLGEPRTLVVVRHSEIVAVPPLAPGRSPAEVCKDLETVQRHLDEEGVALAMGISTVASGVAELPRAYGEARAALGDALNYGGVSALPRLSALDYLARSADDTARRLVDPRIHTFFETDRARGGKMATTLRALADADLNVGLAAQRLHLHRNTAQYRLHRIEQFTGRDPRRLKDLTELLLAIAMDGQPVGI
jgi:hypothetical protein